MAEEYDRLAWGLVREELRHLSKKRPDKLEAMFANTIRHPDGGYYDKGSLGETKQKLLRKRIVSSMQENLSGFHHRSQKVRIEEKGSTTPQDSFYFWDYSPLQVTETTSEQREEKYLDLRHANITVGRKKIVADWLASFVLLNDHTLYRMVQRGLVDSKPLHYLSQHIEEWLRYSNMLVLTHHYVGAGEFGNNMFIPFGNGALLAKMSFTETQLGDKGFGFHNMRFVDGIKGRRVEASPYEQLTSSTFQGKQGAASVCISTWIPQDFFHSEQWWAKIKFQEFMERNKKIVDFCYRAMSSCGNYATEEEAEFIQTSAQNFSLELSKIMTDPRWGRACNW